VLYFINRFNLSDAYSASKTYPKNSLVGVHRIKVKNIAIINALLMKDRIV